MFADTGQYIPKGFAQRFAEAKRSELPRVPSVTLVWRPDRAVHLIAGLADTTLRIPVTQAVIYGWYDNEMGSYVNMLGDRTVTIAENM